jgi:excisionase family DNA binding protein
MQRDIRKKPYQVPEFAGELDVTPACIRRWILEKKISYYKIGRCVRIPASELERLLAEGLKPRKEAR